MSALPRVRVDFEEPQCLGTPPSEGPAGQGRWWGNHLAQTRGSLELARLLVDSVFLPAGVPRGDGRPVVLMPGFLVATRTLAVMAAISHVISMGADL